MGDRRQSIFSAARAKSMARKQVSYDEEKQQEISKLETTRIQRIQASRERRSSRLSAAVSTGVLSPTREKIRNPRANLRADSRKTMPGRPPAMPTRQPARSHSPTMDEVVLPRKKSSRERRTSIKNRTTSTDVFSSSRENLRSPRANRRAMPTTQPARPLSPTIDEVVSPRRRGNRDSKNETPIRPSSSFRRSLTPTPVTIPDQSAYKKMSEYRADLPRRLTGGSPPKNPRLGSRPAPPVEPKRKKRKRLEAASKIKDRETEIVAVHGLKRTSSANVVKTKKVAKKIKGTSPNKPAKLSSTKSKPVLYGLKKKKTTKHKIQVKAKTNEGEEEEDDQEEEEEDEDEEDEKEEEDEEAIEVEKEVKEEEIDVGSEELDCDHSEWESISGSEFEAQLKHQ